MHKVIHRHALTTVLFETVCSVLMWLSLLCSALLQNDLQWFKTSFSILEKSERKEREKVSKCASAPSFNFPPEAFCEGVGMK